MGNSKLSYSKSHPIILHGSHPITKLIVRSEHLCLLHAGPTLLISLSQWFHTVGLRKIARSITRQCVTCKHQSLRPHNQLLGQLPLEWVTPASAFEKVGVDYAGPFQIKYGHVRKPTIVKAYICLFVCLSVKAVHLGSDHRSMFEQSPPNSHEFCWWRSNRSHHTWSLLDWQTSCCSFWPLILLQICFFATLLASLSEFGSPFLAAMVQGVSFSYQQTQQMTLLY